MLKDDNFAFFLRKRAKFRNLDLRMIFSSNESGASTESVPLYSELVKKIARKARGRKCLSPMLKNYYFAYLKKTSKIQNLDLRMIFSSKNANF